MANYILSCDSTADLDAAHFEKRDIRYICFHFYLNGKHYFDDLGKSVPFDVFYKAMEDGVETKTSQVNVDEYLHYFTPILEQGHDLLHVCLSSGLSGSFNSACIARDELAERFPDRKIKVVDSLGASSGFGLLMDKLADLRDGGMGIYVLGGRILFVWVWFGTMLKICPLLNMNYEGRLIPRQKVRTKERVIREIVDKMAANAADGLDYSGKCYISESACMDDARAVASLVESRFKNLAEPVVINSIGTTIGSHTGPGTVALFFWGGKRCD